MKRSIRQGDAPSQLALRQRGGVAADAPQGKRVAQLEALANDAPACAAQRVLVEQFAKAARHTALDIDDSPRVSAQREQLKSFSGGPLRQMTAQRRALHEASDFDGMGLRDTKETFSVVGEYAKGNAAWYADKTSHEAATPAEAMGKIGRASCRERVY